MHDEGRLHGTRPNLGLRRERPHPLTHRASLDFVGSFPPQEEERCPLSRKERAKPQATIQQFNRLSPPTYPTIRNIVGEWFALLNSIRGGTLTRSGAAMAAVKIVSRVNRHGRTPSC
jgi:hypothetical protein